MQDVFLPLSCSMCIDEVTLVSTRCKHACPLLKQIQCAAIGSYYITYPSLCGVICEIVAPQSAVKLIITYIGIKITGGFPDNSGKLRLLRIKHIMLIGGTGVIDEEEGDKSGGMTMIFSL